MIFGSAGIIKEVQEQGKIITKRLNNIKEQVPYQSELEKEKNILQDENIKLKKQIEQLTSSLLSIQKTNKKLIEYIKNIEEVKESNKFKVEEISSNSYAINESKYEIITIPELKIVRKVSDK